MLARLRHPNLILWMGFISRPEPCIVTEYMGQGSLFGLLAKKRAAAAAAAARNSSMVIEDVDDATASEEDGKGGSGKRLVRNINLCN